MKTLLKLSAFTSLIVLIVLGCKKTLPSEESDIPILSKSFNADFVKEWYYGFFKKSTAWKNSSLSGKQLPDWKNGIYHKAGNMEIVEYPLVKKKTVLSVYSGKNFTSYEANKIMEASLTRIAFIKTPDNKITVRELDYIPDPEYLKTMNYDISSIIEKAGKNNFKGRIITRNWNGEALFYSKISDGKFIGRGMINNQSGNTSNTQTCEIYEICEYERFCEEVQVGDTWVETGNCTEWTPTGNCWTEEYCDDEDPCEYMSEEECACMVYGNCNGGEENNCDPSVVSPQEQEFDDYVVMETLAPVMIDAPTTNPGPDPVTGTHIWEVTRAQYGGSWSIKANTNYSYYHYLYYNTNTNFFEHVYDMVSFNTGNGYFVGSNTFIQSTYTQTNPTTNQVFNNNTTNTYGASEVIGTIRHELAIPLNCPICPKTKVSIDDVHGLIKLYPK